jgi:tetratricopeptide (TPR) repeat protein
MKISDRNMLKRYRIIIWGIFSVLPINSQNSNDSVLAFADAQYNSGNYKSAVKEYQRVLFYSETQKPEVLLKLANAEFSCNNWVEARNYYDQVFRLSSSDSIKLEANLRKISSFISEKKYIEALIDLFNINDSIYKHNSFDINILFGICYFGLEDFTQSKQYFELAAGKDSIAKFKIESVFVNRRLMYSPKQSVASVLSTILPGLGQLYSGHITEGMNSFFLTESIMVVAIIVAYQYSFVDAFFTIVPWYQRYYLGGVSKSKVLANEKLQENRSHAYKSVIDILLASSTQ